MGRVRIKKAFTLVELMIVVSILGILGAIVLPAFGDHIQQAKEAAAKDTLRVVRNAINLYAAQHNDVPPGYPSDDTSNTPAWTAFWSQTIRDAQYLQEFPTNPFNDKTNITVVADNAALPAADGSTGWIYKPQTKEFKLNYAGNDSEGVAYYSY